MSKITDQARSPNPLRPNIVLLDGYVLEFDIGFNHRLTNTNTGNASDWTVSSDLSILDDRLIATDPVWDNRFPINQMVQWQTVPNPV